MPALVEGYEYDVFISYRQNDNKYDGWVTKFVENLQKELEATIKGNISVYFDENPHDGLLDTHQVDESLSTKLKCLVFIPIVSQTYCDPECFAWEHEFLKFKEFASKDRLGMYVTVQNGNVASRVLPVMIHKLDETDKLLLEKELEGQIRSIDFIYESPGVNRPLDAKHDDTYREKDKPIYRDQINKVANGVKEILVGIKGFTHMRSKVDNIQAVESGKLIPKEKFSWSLFFKSLARRNVPQTVLVYTILSIILFKLLSSLNLGDSVTNWLPTMVLVVLTLGGILATLLSWFYEFGPEGLMRTASWQSRLNPYPSYKRKPFTGLVTIISLVLILIIQTFYSGYFPELISDLEKESKATIIAVLPFENLNENNRDDYFSVGLTLDITSVLSKITAFTIIPYASVRKYKDDPESIQKVARDLGVSAILTGSVRISGNRVRITSDLIDVASMLSLWGDIYNREIEDVFDVQSDMAQLIAVALNTELSATEKEIIEKKPTNSMGAHDHYMRGRNYYYKYQEESNDSAILEFKAAIRLDSNYAPAWSGLSDSFGQLNKLFGKDISWNDSSIAAGSRAIVLDSNSAEAYKALASAYYYGKQYDEAMDLLKKAVALAPNYAHAVANLGNMYLTDGKLYDALKMLIKGASLDPKSFITPISIGWTYRLLGHLDKAEYWLERSIKITPYQDTYRELGYTFVLQGKVKQALELIPKILALDTSNTRIYEEAGLVALFANELDSAKVYFRKSVKLNENPLSDPNTIAPLALAYFMLNTDRHDDAVVELKRLKEFYLNLIIDGSGDDDNRIYTAGIHSMLGNEDEAILWINRAIDAGWNDMAIIDHVPWFESLRSNEAYHQAISDLKVSLEEMSKKAKTIK